MRSPEALLVDPLLDLNNYRSLKDGALSFAFCQEDRHYHWIKTKGKSYLAILNARLYAVYEAEPVIATCFGSPLK